KLFSGGLLAPGQVYVEVAYDYEYKAKERLISIRQGECYLLVRKTNDDWWQVRGQVGTRAFYVPAQYVREVRRALLPPTTKPKPSSLDLRYTNTPANDCLSTFSRTSSSDTPSPGPGQPILSTPPCDSNQNMSSQVDVAVDSCHQSNNNSLNHFGTFLSGRLEQGMPRQQGSTPGGLPLETEIDKEFVVEQTGSIRHDSESGDELSTSSTELVQSTSPSGAVRSESPVYTNLQELKLSQSSLPPPPSSVPLHTHGEWETHHDSSGRHFYYNTHTHERSWKPPRHKDGSNRADPPSSGDMEVHTLVSFYTHSSQSDSQYGSPPRGWSEELDEHGHTLYVCEYNNEKWIKHVDEQGRQYFYSADGLRSEWELPKYNVSPPPLGDCPKSRSLERHQPEPIILTNWRHSTYGLDLSEKVFTVSFTLLTEQTGPSEKCGVLNVTKTTENGKKVRKNWASTWTVLQGSTLLFAKGQGSGTSWSFYRGSSFPELLLSLLSTWKLSVKPRPAVTYVQSVPAQAVSFGGGQSKPEFTVDLRGAMVEWASKEKSSKKHVIELKTRQGTELLIQSEIDSVINDWYRALSDTISTHAWESDEAIEEDLPESPSEKHKEKQDKEFREPKKNRSTKGSVSMESSEQKKARVKLKKFLIRRPTLQAVRDKGYIKDQVFGCSLSSLCQRENSTVPDFVRMCIEHVEKSGLSVDGLYRVSGNLAVIQKLRFAVNHDEKVDLEDSKWEDIHVTTGALKMFFRELPEPLFTYSTFNDFVNAISESQSASDLIRQLPRPNQDTMQTLFKHLRVIEYGEVNRMTSQGVAIVFGPTLLRPETETGNIALHMVYQNQIVELILLEYESIFGR
uniref:Rho GTPase activating protein 12 n=1 Tax=Denticeps clupeoides TaxID=299321 RepID=A0AAY4A743_9TELE